MKEMQYEKVLRLLRQRPYTTMELVAEYIPAPQKSIELLRDKGFNILTEKIENKKYKQYVLIGEPVKISESGQVSLF